MKSVYSKIFKVFICFIILGNFTSYAVSYNSSTSQSAKENTPVVDNTEKVYDYASLLTDTQEKDLYNEIQSFINEYNIDMVIVTIEKNNKSSASAYADDFYDYNDFGVGNKKSGILFLIDMDNRKMWISTTGDAINIYTDSKIDNILDYAYTKISAKDYNGCAKEFIKYAKSYASIGVQSINFSDEKITIPEAAITAFIFSIIITWIFIIIGCAMHKKPRKRRDADNYISVPLRLTKKVDNFVNSKITKTYIEPPSSSSSSSRRKSSSSSSEESSTHTGSSGTSHGGGGRSF